MPHSFGYRAQTRTLFRKRFRTKGAPNTTRFLKTFKRGDYVDIKVDSSVHKGMPFKYYHGRTGVIFNVTKRAVGIMVKKEVNGRVIEKRINVATPHVFHSKCRDEIIRRKREAEEYKATVRSGSAPKIQLKRTPKLPKEGYLYKMTEAPETIQPLKYIDLV